MRRLLGAWVLAATLALPIFSGAPVAHGQESTPEGPIANTPNPEIGDTISFVSESGSEIARLRATDVILDWQEFSEYYQPQPGFQYVAVTVEVTNLGSRGSLIMRADDFRLQDVDGFFYSRSWADAAEGSELIPSESEVGVGSGETGELVLIYEVVAGIELGHLFWQPEYERLLTIANMDEFIPGQG